MERTVKELSQPRREFTAALCMQEGTPSTHQHAHLEMTRRWLALIAFDIRGASHLMSGGLVDHIPRVLRRAEKLISVVARQWMLLTPELGRPDTNAMADIESDSRLIALMTIAMGQELCAPMGEMLLDPPWAPALTAFRRWRASLGRWSRVSGIDFELSLERYPSALAAN